MQIAEIKHKIQKKVFVFQIITFELAVANSRNTEHDTSHWQAMYEKHT